MFAYLQLSNLLRRCLRDAISCSLLLIQLWFLNFRFLHLWVPILNPIILRWLLAHIRVNLFNHWSILQHYIHERTGLLPFIVCAIKLNLISIEHQRHLRILDHIGLAIKNFFAVNVIGLWVWVNVGYLLRKPLVQYVAQFPHHALFLLLRFLSFTRGRNGNAANSVSKRHF